jgi:hypothetical protein
MAINIDLNLNKVFDVLLHEEKKEESEKKDGTDPSQELENEGRNYRYPLTLTKKYPAYITFSAKKIEGFDFAELAGDIASNRKVQGAVTGAVVGSLGGIPGAIIGAGAGIATAAAIEGTNASEADKELTPEQAASTQSETERLSSALQSYEQKSSGELVGSVSLPLQQSLTFQDGVQYNVANLGIAGIAGSALGSAINGQNPFEGIMSESGQVKRGAGALVASSLARNVGSIAGGLGGLVGGGIIGAGLGTVAGSGIGEGVGAAVKNATRVSSNPNQRTLFENVNMRQFAFNFKMVANNAKEAQEIKNIVKFFREELYPEPIVTNGGIPLAYEFPNVFEIKIKNFNDDEPAPKIQNCYLANVQTVYNGTANSMHTDGNFVEVEINLTFNEIVAMNKKKVREEGY